MPEKCEDCAALGRLEQELREFRRQNGDNHQEIFKRLNDLERGEAAQTVQYKAILEKLDNLTRKVEALEQKPARRWEGLVDRAVWAAAAAVIAYLLAGVGL